MTTNTGNWNTLLNDKVVFLTGGAGHIARHIAQTCYAHGARLVLGDLNIEIINKVKDEIVSSDNNNNKEDRILVVYLDVTDETSIEQAVKLTLDRWKTINVLFNTAAIFTMGDVEHVSSDDWSRIFDVNIRGSALTVKYIAPILKKQCGGSIVNFASVAGMIAYAASVPYGTTKGAVIQLTRNLALDLGPFNIRVNSVSPGHIESPAMDRIAKDNGMSIAEIEDSAAAFHYLGPDYQYETLLQYSGILDDYGDLDGYIYIVGSGDPTLGSPRWNETNGDTIMERWSMLIKQEGIKQCRGIVADLSLWSDDTQSIPDGYPWKDIGNYYGTGNSVLNWRENQFRLILSPGNAVGDPIILVGLDHPPPSLTIVNQAVTGPQGTGDRTNFYLALDGTHGYLRGSLAIDSGKNFSIGGAVPNSGLYITNELRQKMFWPSDSSISFMHKMEMPVNAASDRTTLDVHRSPPISDILYWMEQASINLYGELIVKTIARATNSSFDTVLPTYCQNEHEIERTAVAVIDGSGLSPEDRVTTWALARVLFNVQRAPWFSLFQRALPIIDGIRMKSGYIKNAYSYAGYVNKYVFSIITNNFNGDMNTMRQKLWNLLDILK
ncbi:unnamed protein product [Rotaria sordida]|uniref:Uncharacterized protein n=1 Tax=Rotaria sordida TaxID=392033 RepID=A0A814RP31_9BILA|nr:unnamed protein product [Rotaria sordida]